MVIDCNRFFVSPVSCLLSGHDTGALFYFFIFDLRFKYHLQSLYGIFDSLLERYSMPLLGAKGGVPRCRAPCSSMSEECPVQKAFGIGEWLFISMMMLVRDFFDK